MIMEEDVKYIQSIYINSDPGFSNINLYFKSVVVLECASGRLGESGRQVERKEHSSRVICFNLLPFLLCAMEDQAHPQAWRSSSKGKGVTHVW